MAFLREEFPKMLEEVEKFRRIEEFEMDAALWSRSTLVSILKDVSKDILKIDTKFPLYQQPSMRGFLALQAREAESMKADEEEGSESGVTSLKQ